MLQFIVQMTALTCQKVRPDCETFSHLTPTMCANLCVCIGYGIFFIMQIPSWIIFALLGAVAAAFTGFFAKIGMEGIDSTLATTIRAVIGTAYLLVITSALHKWPHLKSLNHKAVWMMVLCGIAGTSSWLFQYHAMAIQGPLSLVSAIDKLSVPLTIVLAVTLLGEKLTTVNWIGVVLIVAGVYCVAFKPAKPADRPGFPVVTQPRAISTPEASTSTRAE